MVVINFLILRVGRARGACTVQMSKKNDDKLFRKRIHKRIWLYKETIFLTFL